ncbi:MAG: methyltransferase domain-containing protein [Armatimonadetes bacterium]|nr:methyltransferase domain-containing protein [Armatimonadota bacterium]
MTITDWRTFFDSHAPRYDENPFTFNTVAEVDFLLELFPISKGAKILDVGCGTGRHSIELAKRGYAVTGVDLSTGMLAQAERKAKEAGVTPTFIQADAKEFTVDDSFDLAICLCEGAVGLLGSSDDPETHDLQIFKRIASALKPGGGFVLTSLNGYSAIRKMNDEMIRDGLFDPATMLANYVDEWDIPGGKYAARIRERLFTPPETVKLLAQAGLRCDNVYGGTAGHWGRRPLSLDEIEAMYVCRKA